MIRGEEVAAYRFYWIQIMKMGTLANVASNVITLVTLGTLLLNDLEILSDDTHLQAPVNPHPRVSRAKSTNRSLQTPS